MLQRVEFYTVDVIPACPETFFSNVSYGNTIPDKRE
jgi:hypothetical protein